MKNKYKRVAVVLLFAVLTAAPLFQSSQDAPVKPDSDKGLIRMDLLEKEIVPLAPPLRNIFMPDQRRSLTRETLPPPPETGIESIRPENQGGEINPLAAMAIRYVGFTGSQEQIVALVLMNGQALSVKEGDMLSEFIKVLKITRSELEIQGEDSEIRKVLFEGEDR